MTQISWDNSKRPTLFDLIPGAKPGPGDPASNPPFNTLLNQVNALTPGVACQLPLARREPAATPCKQVADKPNSLSGQSPASPEKPVEKNGAGAERSNPSETDTRAESESATAEGQTEDRELREESADEKAAGDPMLDAAALATPFVPSEPVVAEETEIDSTIVVPELEPDATVEDSSQRDSAAWQPTPVSDETDSLASAQGNSSSGQATETAPLDASLHVAEEMLAESAIAANAQSESSDVTLSESEMEVEPDKHSVVAQKPSGRDDELATRIAQAADTHQALEGDSAATSPGANREFDASEESASRASNQADARTASTPTSHRAVENSTSSSSGATSNSETVAPPTGLGDSSSQGGEGQSEHPPERANHAPTENRNAAKAASLDTSASGKPAALPGEAPALRSHPLSARTTATVNEGISTVDRARFIQRVYRALHVAHERGGEIRLRLSPPELGNLTLELKLQDGGMRAHIQAESATARSLLLENLSVLKERLAAQDIHVERFDVDLMERHSRQSPDGQSPDAEAGRTSRRPGNRSASEAASTTTDNAARPSRPQLSNGKLNVVI